MAEVLSKKCTRCGQQKELGDFYYSSGRYHSRCKNCFNEIDRERYKEKRGGKVRKIILVRDTTSGKKQCSGCGEIKDLSEFKKAYTRNNGRESRCRACKNLIKRTRYKKTKNFKSQWLSKYKWGAKVRNLEWSLSNDQFFELVSQNCFYCGQSPEPCNGVDRYDSSIGYIPSNCVPCCFLCNHMKRTLSYSEFISHISRIALYSQK